MSNGSEDTASYVDGAATANITRLHRATPPLTGTFGAEIYRSGVEGSSHRHALFLLRRKIAPSAVFHHKAKSLQWPLTDTWYTSLSSNFDRQLLLWTKMVFMRVIRQHASKHACKTTRAHQTHRRVLTSVFNGSYETKPLHFNSQTQTSKSAMMTCQTLSAKVWVYKINKNK